MSENLDIYNIKKERTGKIIERTNDNKLNKGEYLLGVHCWIINDNGEILLTQRRLNKTHGGMWEPTSGLVTSGETSMQGIKRELSEEIGLNIVEDKISLIKEIREEGETINTFRDIYLIKNNYKLSDLNFSDGEVIDAKYVTIDELNTMIKNGESFNHFSYFIDLYKQI